MPPRPAPGAGRPAPPIIPKQKKGPPRSRVSTNCTERLARCAVWPCDDLTIGAEHRAVSIGDDESWRDPVVQPRRQPEAEAEEAEALLNAESIFAERG